MLWKKPANLHYTDLCIYIDEHVTEIVEPGKNPEIEEKIYNYLWLLVKALAIKKRMFQDFKDYDGYAFYSATRLFFALRKNQLNQGKVIKGKLIAPIKSCLNYTKALLYPMKLEYQNESYKEIIDEEFISTKFDSFALQEKLKSEARESQNTVSEFKYMVIDSFQNFDAVVERVLTKLPFNKDSLEYKRIKISILLNCLNSLRLKNKLTADLQGTVVWKLPKSMTSYINVLVRELFSEIKQELLNCYDSAMPDNQTLEKILSYRDKSEYNVNEQY